MAEIKSLIKEARRQGKTGPIDLESDDLTEKLVERRLKKQTLSPPDPDADDGSLMTAMSQLAWEKDIDLTKGTAFTKDDTIREEAETTATRTSSPGDQTPLLKDGGNVKTGMGTAKAVTQSIAPPSGSRGPSDIKSNPKMHTAKVHPNDVQPISIGVKGKNIDYNDPPTAVTVSKDGLMKTPRKKPHAKGPLSRPSSSVKMSPVGSKDSTFISEGDSRSGRRTNLAISGSRSSLNSTSSLTSLLLASDSKDPHKKPGKHDSTEF